MKQSDLYRSAMDVQHAKEARNKLMRKFEYKFKPFKRGDRTKVTGFSYTDKMCEVMTCRLVYNKYCNSFEWMIHGKVIKKDGNPGHVKVVFPRKLREGK